MLEALAELADQLILPIREVHLVFLGRAHNASYVMFSAGMLGVAAGLVGSFAMLRNRTLMADALGHATLPGICLAFLIADALGGPARAVALLLVGAAISGVLGVWCVQQIVRRTRLRDDVAIGMVLSVFFGVGIVLLDLATRIASTPAGGLSHLIYGQTAAMTQPDAITMAIVLLSVVIVCLLLFKEFTLLCFNEPFAAVTGWPVRRIDLMLMALVVLVTVSGLQAVGIILIVAMLIIPAAAARLWTNSIGVMVLLAGCIGGLSGYVGAAISAAVPRSPAGAIIVLTAGVLFILSLLMAPSRGIVPAFLRRVRQATRFAADHALESMASNHAVSPASSGLSGRLIGVYLCLAGLAKRQPSGLTLTSRGLERGLRVARNHRLWEQYLITFADVAPSHVDWSVDQVEHILSSDMIERLESDLAAIEGSA